MMGKTSGISAGTTVYLVKCCFGKAGIGAAPVIRGEVFQCLVLASQEAAPYWAVRNNPNAQLPTDWNNIFLQIADK